MAFDEETMDVLIGGYMSKDAAEDDYEAVLASGGYLHGAVVVSKDLEGNLSVEQTDHTVRGGAEGLGAVGFAVGLFAPPLLAATAVGAVIGAGADKLLHHRTAGKLEAGATIPLGGAGLIVAYPRSASREGGTGSDTGAPEGGRRSRRAPRESLEGRGRRCAGEDGRRRLLRPCQGCGRSSATPKWPGKSLVCQPKALSI